MNGEQRREWSLNKDTSYFSNTHTMCYEYFLLSFAYHIYIIYIFYKFFPNA